MIASCCGHTNIVDLLIENKANVNQRNTDGDTPLILGIKKHYNIGKCLKKVIYIGLFNRNFFILL